MTRIINIWAHTSDEAEQVLARLELDPAIWRRQVEAGPLGYTITQRRNFKEQISLRRAPRASGSSITQVQIERIFLASRLVAIGHAGTSGDLPALPDHPGSPYQIVRKSTPENTSAW